MSTGEKSPGFVTLADIKAYAKDVYGKMPNWEYTDEETGWRFKFRHLNANDVARIASEAGTDEAKYDQLLVEAASIEPKIDIATWGELGQLSPMIRITLAYVVKEECGVGMSGLTAAKNATARVVRLG